jgi:hypothetical protein
MAKAVWKALFHVEGILAVLFFAVLLFNRELGARLLLWEGIDPRWAWIPVGFLFGHLYLKAVYDNYLSLKKEKDAAIATLKAELKAAATEQTQPSARPVEEGVRDLSTTKASQVAVDDPREFFIGQWRLEKGNGQLGAYVAELHDGGGAQKISGGMVKNVAGTWGYVNAGGWAMGGQAEIKWDDGTTDVLRVVKIGRRADGTPFDARAVKIKGR